MTQYETYRPDCWVIVKITDKSNGHFHHRIFGTWGGGYLNGDSWKMNSGITNIGDDGDKNYLFKGYSGSVYEVRKTAYRLSGYGSSVLNHLTKNAEGVTIEILEDRDQWTSLELEG